MADPHKFNRSFTIEQKSSTIEHSGKAIRISERRGRNQSFALFPEELGEWLAQICEGAHNKKDGFLNAKHDGEVRIYVSKKKNRRGSFITLMVVSPRILQGAKCPEGKAAAEWKNLADCVRSVAQHAMDPQNLQIVPVQAQPHRAPPAPEQPQQQREAPMSNNNRRRQANQRKDRPESSGVRVRIVEGDMEAKKIPKLLKLVLGFEQELTISTLENSQDQRLSILSQLDAAKFEEVHLLKLKSGTLEFSKEVQPPTLDCGSGERIRSGNEDGVGTDQLADRSVIRFVIKIISSMHKDA